jgi:alpha-beta hydrolase superfamily lysophospholipase
VYDLRTSDTDERKQSTLQTLNSLGYATYALDFRGFGETNRDDTGFVTPQRSVDDVLATIKWIQERHGISDSMDSLEGVPGNTRKTSLLGWSQGALVAQMYAQQHGRETLSDVTLFGSIYDPKVVYPRAPLYAEKTEAPTTANTREGALEDFTLPGTICDEAALNFESLALAADPVKSPWSELHEFNTLTPSLVQVPTHIIVGQQDPYVSWDAQRELFERLGTPDKAWTVLPNADHAAHILSSRHSFLRAVVGFLRRKDPFSEI